MSKKVKKSGSGVEALQEGDIVDVIAPGFPCAIELIEKAREVLARHGLKARIPEDIIVDHPLYANTDERRMQMLHAAIKAKDSKAIWCLRGGYGSNRLLPTLEKIKNPKPKIVVGLSDITSLHGYFIQNWKWSGLHGSLLDRLAKGQVPADIEKELFAVVKGEQTEIIFTKLEALNAAAKKKKKIEAPILGGNLKVVEGHVGTDDEFSFKNKIAFFEEIGERGYRVDRMLFHLSEAGAFKNCSAVVFGTFTGGEEPKADPNAPTVTKVDWVIKEWAKKQKFPVLQGLPCGHDTIQRVLPLGTEALLSLTADAAELRVQTGVKKCD